MARILCVTLLGFYLLKPINGLEQPGTSRHDARLVVLNNASELFLSKIFDQYVSNGSDSLSVGGFQGLLKRLHIGKLYKLSAQVIAGNRSSTAEREKTHSHYQKRTVERRGIPHLGGSENSTGLKHQQSHQQCLDGNELLHLHDIDETRGIHKKDFVQLCPSLVYQVQSGACVDGTASKLPGKASSAPTSLQVWGYGLLSITVISLSSLFAIAIIPLMATAVYKKVMSFLVALAVGTLSADALLHLIPHVFLKDSNESNPSHNNHETAVWKAIVIMAGIYLFFLVESLMRVRASNKGHHHHHHPHEHHQHQHDEHQHISEQCQAHSSSSCQSQPSALSCRPLVGSRLAGIHRCHSREDLVCLKNTCSKSPTTSDINEVMTEISTIGSLECGKIKEDENEHTLRHSALPDKSDVWKTDDATETTKHSYSESQLGDMIKDNDFIYNGIYQEKDFKQPCLHDDVQCHSNLPCSQERPSSESNFTASEASETEKIEVTDHHHHHHHHGDKNIDSSTPIATVAWMVIVGDGFHNFSDGLAVGAAFSGSLMNGLTTTIAVFCHELPHELGDFAILIKSGLTFKQAMAYNMASAIISYIGLILGIIIGNIDTTHGWVLALTAGMFLYVSLVGMLPELSSYQEEGGYAVFLSQNAGILTGILIMLAIALLE